MNEAVSFVCIIHDEFFQWRSRARNLLRLSSLLGSGLLEAVQLAMSHPNCNLHPSFQSKSVYELKCNICDALVCARGMRAILLADRNVQLYSTDLPPPK